MKTIIIALIGLSAIYCAAVDFSSCGANDINHNGVCQKSTNLYCKTFTNGVCAACHATTTTANIEAAPNCACKTGKFFDIQTATYDCHDAKTTVGDNHKCPDGFGLTNIKTKAGECKKCTEDKCKSCNATVADTEALGTCTACYGDATLTGGACGTDSSTNDKLIVGHGWVAACPAGYVEDNKVCKACLPGCAACTVADVAAKCTKCAEGWLLASDKCTKAATADGADACDASCKSQKCATTAAFCTECADATYVWTAEGKCTKKPTVFGCKTYVDGKTDECKECDTGYKLDGKVCVCTTAGQYIKETKYAAASGATAAVYWKIECAACDPACTAPKVCLANGTCGEAPAATTAAATVATSDQPGAACTDATLKASGCVKCADGTKCDTCFAGQAFNTTEKVCLCSAGADTAAWDAATMKCVNCPAKCADATKKFCNIKTAGTASTAAVAECTGTAPAAAAKAAGEAAAAAATGNDSNGILISAISMILAVILA